MIIGYARVSTDDQRLDLQLAALKEAGCKNIFQDHGATGSHMDRPGLENVLRALKPGDTLVVWRLDRLGRSLTDLVKFVEELGRKGCEFRSLNESIDTRTSGGRLIFHIMAAFAEFERNLISERTRAGLVAARQRGSRLGRPRIVLTEAEINEARRAIKEKRQTLDEIAAGYQISSTTLRRRLETALTRERGKDHILAKHANSPRMAKSRAENEKDGCRDLEMSKGAMADTQQSFDLCTSSEDSRQLLADARKGPRLCPGDRWNRPAKLDTGRTERTKPCAPPPC